MSARLLEDLHAAILQARSRRFSSCAIVTLVACLVGANVTVLSLLNAIALRPLPLDRARDLVTLSARTPEGTPRPIYFDSFSELRRLNVFDDAALFAGGGVLWVEARGSVGEGAIEAVTPGLYEMIGLKPALGRFISDVDAPGTAIPAPVAVISHRFWQRFHGGDPGVVGERLLINKVPFTIIGVAPRHYRGLHLETGYDFAIPLSSLGRQLATNQFPLDPKAPIRGFNVIARLKPEISVAGARSAVTAAWNTLRHTTAPSALAGAARSELVRQHIVVESFANGFSTLRDRYASRLTMVSVFAVLLFGIGCLNLTGLFLAADMARSRDQAIRLALGASPFRLLRVAWLETTVVCLAGVTAGIVIGSLGSRALTAVLSDTALPLSVSTTPDRRVIAVAVAMAALAAFLIRALPAATVLRSAWLVERGTSRFPSIARYQAVMLVPQIALAFGFLIFAGMCAATLRSSLMVDVGANSDGLRWTRLLQQPGGYADIDEASYYAELVRVLSELPGIESVALSHHFPGFFRFGNLVTTQPVAAVESGAPADTVEALMESISPGFFETTGIDLVHGRDFTWRDDGSRDAVAIVNEALARSLFGDLAVVGRRIRVGHDRERQSVEIVGVARNAAIGDYRATTQPVVFRPKLQEARFMRMPIVLYRTRGGEASDAQVADAVRRLGREYVRTAWSLDDEADKAMRQERLLSTFAVTSAALATALTAIGLFAAVAYNASRRTREFAVRMALGASSGRVMRTIVMEAVRVVALGVAIGAAVAATTTSYAGSRLAGIAPATPGMVFGALMVVTLVALLAALIPAWRASATQPAVLLRQD